MEYKEQTFNIPELEGISKESIDQHLALYAGYVKNFNAISALLPEYAKDSEKHAHALSELIRRRSFEFGGMRLHEHYFTQFETGATPMPTSGPLFDALKTEYGEPEHLEPYLKAIGNMRGPGWAVLYFDPIARQPARTTDGVQSGGFLAGFVGEQHQGHFVTLPIILALDVWEHAYILDYGASGKGKYLDAFFKNLNWSVIEKRYTSAVQKS
jgi:Fe-Mn family superoxide dismutase